jgi:hypothetical protein
MPSIVPIRSSVAQTAVDFNNQSLINSGNFFKYKSGIFITNAATYNAGISDINSIITSNYNENAPFGTLELGYLNTAYTGRLLNNGSEILVWTTDNTILNNILIKASNNAGLIVNRNNSFYTLPQSAAKLTLVDSVNNRWILSGKTGQIVTYSFTNCCEQIEYFKQITDDLSGSISGDLQSRYYFDYDDITKPYNGIYYDGTDWLQVINGVYISSSSCSTYNFTTSYTFYTVLGDYTSAVVGYSMVGQNENDPSTFLGLKVFNDSVSDQYPCYTGVAAFPDGTYYTTNSAYSLEFYKGYVISYAAF